MKLEPWCLATAVLLSLGSSANGVAMLIAPEAWYFAIPGVTTTGPFNQHLIRDVGLIFVLIGAAFAYGALRPASRLPLWAAASAWLAGHALFHFWEAAVGICSVSALPRDFPGVTLPAILGSVLTGWAYRNPARRREPSR